MSEKLITNIICVFVVYRRCAVGKKQLSLFSSADMKDFIEINQRVFLNFLTLFRHVSQIGVYGAFKLQKNPKHIAILLHTFVFNVSNKSSLPHYYLFAYPNDLLD